MTHWLSFIIIFLNSILFFIVAFCFYIFSKNIVLFSQQTSYCLLLKVLDLNWIKYLVGWIVFIANIVSFIASNLAKCLGRDLQHRTEYKSNILSNSVLQVGKLWILNLSKVLTTSRELDNCPLIQKFVKWPS